MPIHKIVKDGRVGYKWGNHGHTYPTRAQAVKQAQAAHANGYQEHTMKSNATKRK